MASLKKPSRKCAEKQQAEQKRPVNNKQNAKTIICILANMVAIIIGIFYVEKYKIFNDIELSKSPHNDDTYRNYTNVKHTDHYNRFELQYKKEIDDADDLVNTGQLTMAFKRFDEISRKIPNSPRCIYSKALIMDKLSEIEGCNVKLQSSIDFYKKLFDEDLIKSFESKEFHIKSGLRLVNRLIFFGKSIEALVYNRRLCQLYPDNLQLMNELGIAYIIADKPYEAKNQFEQVLERSSNNAVALVHLGFVLKQFFRNISGSLPYLQRGIDTMDAQIMDSRFFFHLGDALQRTGDNKKAYFYYEIGTQNGLFMSPYQRSIYNVASLKAQPWWSIEETNSQQYFKEIEKHWIEIRDEGLSLLDSKTKSFVSEDENLREKGDWQQFTLYARGKKLESNCKRAPITCKLIDKFAAAKACKRGQVKFSVMYPQVHVWPHCGPTNCRLRAHLGLKIPDGAFIRVGNNTNQWIESKFIIFDDSFEHEVWHNGTDFRLVLIVDFWHPQLRKDQIDSLTPI